VTDALFGQVGDDLGEAFDDAETYGAARPGPATSSDSSPATPGSLSWTVR
jgi:hypothetical protein